jgi:hypothetical protein
MDLNKELWDVINATPKLSEEIKKSLHVKILRLFQLSKSPTGEKLGVTFMTQEGSLAGDRTAASRSRKGSPGDSKPKSV